MSFEPYSIRVQFGAPVTTGGRKRTPEEYRADLVRRFGKIPTPAELAASEVKRRGWISPTTPTAASSAETIERAAKKREWRVRTATAKVQAAYRDILGAMHGPTTVIAIAEVTGRSRQAVAVHLSNLEREGLVTSHYPHGTNRAATWKRVQEATE